MVLVLLDRQQIVFVSGFGSALSLVGYDVPRGSVLRPIRFVLYMTLLEEIFSCHSVGYHAFADNTTVPTVMYS